MSSVYGVVCPINVFPNLLAFLLILLFSISSRIQIMKQTGLSCIYRFKLAQNNSFIHVSKQKSVLSNQDSSSLIGVVWSLLTSKPACWVSIVTSCLATVVWFLLACKLDYRVSEHFKLNCSISVITLSKQTGLLIIHWSSIQRFKLSWTSSVVTFIRQLVRRVSTVSRWFAAVMWFILASKLTCRVSYNFKLSCSKTVIHLALNCLVDYQQIQVVMQQNCEGLSKQTCLLSIHSFNLSCSSSVITLPSQEASLAFTDSSCLTVVV